MERVELTQLIRKRERVMKCDAETRSQEMVAEFDRSIAKIYTFDSDEVWKSAAKEALTAIEEANKKVKERCRLLGIPEEFAPSIYGGWQGRGENAVAGRRAELRRMAKSRIEAILKDTKSKIERMSLDAQTEVVSNGLESMASKSFLEKMPTMEKLMPPVDAIELKTIMEGKKNSRLQIMDGGLTD